MAREQMFVRWQQHYRWPLARRGLPSRHVPARSAGREELRSARRRQFVWSDESRRRFLFGLNAGITWHIGVRLLTSGHPRNRRTEESLSSIRLYSSDFPLKPRKPPSTGKTATASKLDAVRQVWPVDGQRGDPPSSAQRTTAAQRIVESLLTQSLPAGRIVVIICCRRQGCPQTSELPASISRGLPAATASFRALQNHPPIRNWLKKPRRYAPSQGY